MIKELVINDQNLIKDFTDKVGLINGELSLTNLLMWNHSYKTKYFLSGNSLFYICGEGKDTWAFCPQSIGDEIDLMGFKDLMEYFESIGQPLVFKRVWEGQISMLKEVAGKCGIELEEEYDRDNSDYVYLKDKLLTLSGKKLHSKRNHLNYFLNNYDYKVEVFDNTNICESMKEECRKVLKKWNDEFRVDQELVAQYWLIDNLENLACKTVLISIDGEYKALAIAELLNRDTIVVHTEKADHEIRGLYQAINRETVKVFEGFEDVEYVNREQDCGDEGMRKAKTSYHPHHMVEKYTLIKKSHS